MKKKEKMLLAGLVGVLLIAQGIPLFSSLFVAPFKERRESLASLKEQVDDSFNRWLEIRAAQKEYQKWQERSLPPDILKAQRLYQEWLTDIAGLSGFQNPKISPVRRSKAGKVFTPLQVSIDGQATYDQIGKFLFHFHRTNLAQRIVELSVDGKKNSGNGPLSVKITVEGISLQAAPQRDDLFPRVKLADVIDAKVTELTIDKEAEGFPDSLPFTVRIGHELVKVIEQTDKKWKLERGQVQTVAKEHLKGDFVEYVDVLANWEKRDFKDYQPVLAHNLFAKPPADKAAVPILNKIEKQILYLGQTITLTATIDEAYKPKQKLKYTLEGKKPPGAKMDASKGILTWKPKPDTKPSKVEVTIKVIDGSSKKLSSETKFQIEIKKDDAAQTFLVASFAGAEDKRVAWLHHDEKKLRTTLEIGTKIKVADVEGEVKTIDDDFIEFAHDGKRWKLNLGDNLRALKELPSEVKEEKPKTS